MKNGIVDVGGGLRGIYSEYASAFSVSFEEAYIPMNKYHKMFVAKWYLLLYQIQDDAVYVDYILDCRKDYSWLIR